MTTTNKPLPTTNRKPRHKRGWFYFYRDIRPDGSIQYGLYALKPYLPKWVFFPNSEAKPVRSKLNPVQSRGEMFDSSSSRSEIAFRLRRARRLLKPTVHLQP